MDIKEIKDKTKETVTKVTGWRDYAVTFATSHPKTTLLLLGGSAVVNVYLLLGGLR